MSRQTTIGRVDVETHEQEAGYRLVLNGQIVPELMEEQLELKA